MLQRVSIYTLRVVKNVFVISFVEGFMAVNLLTDPASSTT